MRLVVVEEAVALFHLVPRPEIFDTIWNKATKAQGTTPFVVILVFDIGLG